jgi:hypothetical protein
MTALSAKATVYPPRIKADFTIRVKGGVVIYPGAHCAIVGGLLQPVEEALGLEHFCTSTNKATVDNSAGADGDVSCPVEFDHPKTLVVCSNDSISPVTVSHIGGDAYAVDDSGLVSADGTGRTRVGTPWIIVSASDPIGQRAGVYVELDVLPAAATLEADLASTANGDGASMVAIEDAGNFTTEEDLEGVTQEIYQHLKTTQGTIDLKPSDFYLLTGAPLAIFANGASAVPGSALVDSKAFGVRWNNNATLDGIVTSFLVPPDADITANMTLTIRASKTGATLADAVTFDVGAYNQVVGALHDADTNFGGTSSAMTGDATAKTIQAVTRTLALADLAASPASVTLTVKPTDGTLGTDDLVLHSVRITYKRKLLTS